MTTKPPKGSCSQCGRELSKGGAIRHLQSCLGSGPDLLVSVFSPYGPWWLVVAAPARTTFSQVDWLLRETWLDCCGHMSDFELRRREWLSERGGMERRLVDVLGPGATFTHVYDFGTSTHLSGKLYRGVRAPGEGPVVVMRNHAPSWPCHECGALATHVCNSCGATSCGCTRSCPGCGQTAEVTRLPVLNSPRMGMCAYVG